MSEKVEVRKSKIQGKGVFALKDFKKDELIMRIEGKVVETEDHSSLSEYVQDHCFPFNKKGKKRFYVLPNSPWTYVNHSCEPNAGIKNNRTFVAIRKIKKGEEIFFDYCMNNFDDWTMECKCGSKTCRKLISTLDVLDKKTRKKYNDYVLDCLKQ